MIIASIKTQRDIEKVWNTPELTLCNNSDSHTPFIIHHFVTKTLYLEGNFQFGSTLTNLTYLEISKIHAVDSSIGLLTHLKGLSILGTPLPQLPDTIKNLLQVKMGFRWKLYFQFQDNPQQKLISEWIEADYSPTPPPPPPTTFFKNCDNETGRMLTLPYTKELQEPLPPGYFQGMVKQVLMVALQAIKVHCLFHDPQHFHNYVQRYDLASIKGKKARRAFYKQVIQELLPNTPCQCIEFLPKSHKLIFMFNHLHLPLLKIVDGVMMKEGYLFNITPDSWAQYSNIKLGFRYLVYNNASGSDPLYFKKWIEQGREIPQERPKDSLIVYRPYQILSTFPFILDDLKTQQLLIKEIINKSISINQQTELAESPDLYQATRMVAHIQLANFSDFNYLMEAFQGAFLKCINEGETLQHFIMEEVYTKHFNFHTNCKPLEYFSKGYLWYSDEYYQLEPILIFNGGWFSEKKQAVVVHPTKQNRSFYLHTTGYVVK